MTRPRAGLTRLYDRLKPAERFRLAIQAMARDDKSEFDRLSQTCPAKAYRVTDADYTERVQASQTLALGVSVDLARMLGQYSVADAVIGMYSSFETTRQILAQNIRMLWDAFGECCREELELEPDVVLGAWVRPVLEELKAVLANTRASPPAQEEVGDAAKILKQIWRERTGDEDR